MSARAIDGEPAPGAVRGRWTSGLAVLAAARALRLRRTRAVGRLSARGARHSERRSHLLHDGPQPRRRWRPDLSPRGSRARLARVSERPDRRVPEEGPNHRRFGLMRRLPFVWTARAARSRRRGSTTASRSSTRWSRRPSCGCSAPTAFWCCTRCCSRSPWCGYLFLHARSSRPATLPCSPTAFVMASVVPVYFVWITPELFNFALVLLGVLLLALQGGGAAASSPRGVALAARAVRPTSSPPCCSASRRSRRSPNVLLYLPIAAVARYGSGGGARLFAIGCRVRRW